MLTIQVALKTYAQDAHQDLSIAYEVVHLSLMCHHNIISLCGLITTETHWHLLLELHDGVTLSEYIEARASYIEETEARWFAEQIGSALAYCHAHLISHQSLTAGKVLLKRFGHVKITGFRASRLAVNLEEFSPQKDAWSFGVIIWTMLWGGSPFQDDTTAISEDRLRELDLTVSQGKISLT